MREILGEITERVKVKRTRAGQQECVYCGEKMPAGKYGICMNNATDTLALKKNLWLHPRCVTNFHNKTEQVLGKVAKMVPIGNIYLTQINKDQIDLEVTESVHQIIFMNKGQDLIANIDLKETKLPSGSINMYKANHQNTRTEINVNDKIIIYKLDKNRLFKADETLRLDLRRARIK